MAPSQPKADARGNGLQSLNRGKRPQGITKYQSQTATCKSALLEEIQHPQKRAGSKDRSTQRHHFPSPSTSNTHSKENSPVDLKAVDSIGKRKQSQRRGSESAGLQKTQCLQPELKRRNIGRANSHPPGLGDYCKRNEHPLELPVFEKPLDQHLDQHLDLEQRLSRKRKRSQEAESPLPQIRANPTQKKHRTSLANSAVKEASGQEMALDKAADKVNPISYWIREGIWPEEYKTGKDFDFEQRNDMSHLFVRKRSRSSLRRTQSDPSDITPSDQKPREEKSGPYNNPRYKIVLETKGSFMEESDLGITDNSKSCYQNLLNAEQTVPKDSLFCGGIFKTTCRKIQDRNEARVIRDISLLIVPSAETLATRGATNLLCLIESTNEGWNNSIPVTTTRPQPDYSVGFKRSAFTENQLKKLDPFVGGLYDNSFFMATYYMYFPFLTCEVKCGAGALDVADRQNAHSMTIAVRGIVELFKYVNREKEIDREILAFSISHDHESVRIYGHYALINENDTTFYRQPIRKFDFTEQDGRDRWTAYKFTKNVYDHWMPTHLKRICSAIDIIPADIDFGVSSITSTENEYELPGLKEIATSAPSSQGINSFKKPKLPTKATLQQENERLNERLKERDEQFMLQINRLTDQQKEQMNELKREKDDQREQIKELTDMLKRQISSE